MNILIFGDFTQDECKKIDMNISTPVVFASNSSNIEQIILFGDFTYEECLTVHCQNMGINIPKNNTSRVESSLYYSHSEQVNIFYDIPCARCGYHSHTIDKCFAKRNRYGEFINKTLKKNKKSIIPISPTASPRYTDGPVYYNQHISLNDWSPSDKTDYSQFLFTEEDIQEWIHEDNESTRLAYYHPGFRIYPHSSIPISLYENDSNMDYILRYNYMITDNMIYTY
jgi:hypothetical protein